MKTLKAPMPYFGGKSRVAPLVWERIGDVDNYIEPFCGSAAMLLLRPHPPKIETINDLDCYCSNFWRATSRDPGAVAEHADWPVNEADLHARHRWLVLSEPAAEFRKRMRSDPDYYDARIAGWWCWGLCCWIGGGWCKAPEEESRDWIRTQNVPAICEGGRKGVHREPQKRRPRVQSEGSQGLPGVHAKMPNCDSRGIHAPAEQLPKLASGDGMDAVPLPEKMPGAQGSVAGMDASHTQDVPHYAMNINGRGIHVRAAALPDDVAHKKPRLVTGGPSGGGKTGGEGIHAGGTLAESDRRPGIDHCHGLMNGVASATFAGMGPPEGNRPQLADAFPRGRGVNGNDAVGTCEQRRAWLIEWFGRLRDRLRTVRVCCGDWLRVCDSESVTTRLGVTGIFLDPPYSTEAGRDMNLYATESGDVAHAVRAYCLERGGDKMYRICLAGYAGEGHEELEAAGWSAVAWKAQGGYGNRTKKGKDNSARERLWFSPHCTQPPTLYDLMGGTA